MLRLILSLLIAVSGALTITAKYRRSKRLEYVFKPLTTSLIILLALLDPNPVSGTYKALIVGGLAASLVGDVLLMLEDRFLEGLAAFLAAHVFYIAAFTHASEGSIPFYAIIPFLLFGAIMLYTLWSALGTMRTPVMIYMGVILIMAFMAANRWLTTDDRPGLLALIGAYLFVTSDSVLAVERFRGAFRSAAFWVLTTYFTAQWFIAMSI